MITKKLEPVFRLFCDRCGCQFESYEGYNKWLDEDSMLFDSEAYEEWYMAPDGRHYCPDCYH